MLKLVLMKPNNFNITYNRLPSVRTFFGRGFSTSKLNDKIYELRTYYIHPKETKALLDACNKWMHIRTSYSKMVGFWLSEIGGMNDVLHLWEYDDLAHRAKIRQALAADTVWQREFISKILPMLLRQENRVAKCLPGTFLTTPTYPGIYEIQNFHVDGVDLKIVGKHLKEITKPGALLVGSFYSIVGDLSSGFLLWQYPDLQMFDQDLNSLHKIPGIKFGNSRILLPTAFSAMK